MVMSEPVTCRLVASIENLGIGARIVEIQQICAAAALLNFSETSVCSWNYQSAWTWDIFLLPGWGEMVNRSTKHDGKT